MVNFALATWIGLISVTFSGLFGFGWYIWCLTILSSFIVGILTLLIIRYDEKQIFPKNIDKLDDPLQHQRFSVALPKVLQHFQNLPKPEKFDNRITGSETVDSFLNEIITIIINDYVVSWYEIVTTDNELTNQAIKKMVLGAGVNVANRVKCVDWVHLLSTKFPEEITSHLKLYKQSKIRLKHVQLSANKDVPNGSSKLSPKRNDDRKLHKRNKSDTDLSWPLETQTFGRSKFYDSTECINGKTLKDMFFDLECSLENKKMCRDLFCNDPDKEYALLSEVSEAIFYLIAPEEAWKCHALKLLMIELFAGIVFKPIIELLSDPDVINRAIIRMCCRDTGLSSELFLMVIRCTSDAEELDATLELVQKDIQKLHSKDSAGEWEIQDRQKLSSLQYLARIIQARRSVLGPEEGLNSNANSSKMSDEVTRSLKFLNVSTAWRSNAQYCLEIEFNETDSAHSAKAVLDNLRSSALEICDMYLAPNRPTILGLPDNCYSEIVRKITTEGEDFTNNPVACFDDIQKAIYDALEDDPTWQSDFMFEDQEPNSERLMNDLNKEDKDKKYTVKCKKYIKKYLKKIPKIFSKPTFTYEITDRASTFPRCLKRRESLNKNHTLPRDNKCADTLVVPGLLLKHNRSRSDIVGNNSQKLINDGAGPSTLSKTNANLSMSHSSISSGAKNMFSPLSACVIETALVQEKGKAFGIYAIAVTRLSDNDVWHIYRRYSDFHDLHCSIKEKWPELGHLPFPAKKTFQNTSRSVLENRKRTLNSYLQSLTNLARDARYMALLSSEYLGGFLSQENQAEKQSHTIDALLVNSLRAGMRTLKNMPDQFANTVDGVMDGISKVFQGKHTDYEDIVKNNQVTETQDDADESAALRLLEEVLGLRGLWLRRRLLAPVRTLIADRVNRKVFELVSSLTSPRNVVQYLKYFKQWLTERNNHNSTPRDPATKARTRVAAKVGLLSAYSDELRHLVGSDTARRGLLNLFDLFQNEEINKRLIFVFLEVVLINLFPDNNMQDMFKTLYSNSPRVAQVKKSTIV